MDGSKLQYKDGGVAAGDSQSQMHGLFRGGTRGRTDGSNVPAWVEI